MKWGKIVSDRYFWVLCVMGAFAILSSTMSKNPVLNPFALSIGTPQDLTGIIAAASTIPGIIVSLPAGSLSEKYGRKKMLLFSAFIFASAPFLYLFVTVWWQLAIVRFYHGFATAIFVPVAEAAIAERYPTKRGERISSFNSSTYIGRGAAPFLGGAILTVTNAGSITLHNFGVLYLAVGVAGVTSLIITLLLFRDTKNAASQPFKTKLTTSQMLHGWMEVARNKSALTISFVQAIQYYVFGVVEFYLVQYMQQVAGFNALEFGIVMGVQLISLIVSRPIMGRFSDKTSRRTPIILGCLISATLLFLIPFTTSFVVLILISIGFGLGFAMVVSSTAPLMCELSANIPLGTSMGFLSTMMDVGQAIGPIISGVILATVLSYNGLFSSLTVLLMISATVFFFSGIAKRKI
ncbi:MAG TPA: MFS transporter [Candidatus Acidoferrum sp.]|nr:MFS transporter [Candidatus Acidoferrum sp.]